MDDKMFEALNALANKLGVTVEYLWGILIKQAGIEVVNDLIFYAIVAAIIIATWYLARICIKRAQKSWVNNELWIGTALCGGVLSVFLLLISINSIGSTITKIRNPEYWALKQITSVLK